MQKREMLTKEGFLMIGIFFMATCLKEVLSQDLLSTNRYGTDSIIEEGTYEAGTCPPEFATADVLFCNGACGDDWGDDIRGCQQADADAYCKLFHCDENQVATAFDHPILSGNDNPMTPGFGCMYGKEKLDVDFDKYEGTWFGIQDVHFTTGTHETHGSGEVIINAVCETLLETDYTFHKYRGCVDRNELFSGTVADRGECRSKCDADDQCLSFEWWGASNPHPGGDGWENWCQTSTSCTLELSVYDEDDTLYTRDLYDECALGTHNCDPNAACTDNPGAFDCQCISGYAGDGWTCTDIDECATGSDNCDDVNGVCTNRPGGFDCACNTGFTGDGTACSDLDECALATHDCHYHALCTNTEGDFTCACNSGYDGDGTDCADVDECSAGTYTCDGNAGCINTIGAYSCNCNSGYVGDGATCAAGCAQLSEIVGMTCAASSESNAGGKGCENAIDGDSNTDWATNGEGTGAWIQLNFGDAYTVEKIKIKHRSTGNSPADELFRDISLDFSDGSQVTYTLNDVPFTSGLVWNEVDLTVPPIATYVKITATSVYDTINNGFSEIEIYGCSADHD